MAIIIKDEFVGKSNAADANYPQGSERDITTSGDGTGTPRTARGQNDAHGFHQKLLNVAGITPSGSPDTVLASDYFDGLMTVVTRPTLTVTTMAATVGVRAGNVFNVAERSAGNGGGGFWKAVVTGTTAGVDLPNALDIIISTADLLISFALRVDNTFNPLKIGATGDGIVDDSSEITRCELLSNSTDGLGLTYLVTSIPDIDKFKNASFQVGEIVHKTRDFLPTQTTKITDAGVYTSWPQDSCYKIGDQLVVWVNEGESHTDGTKHVIKYVSDDGGISWQHGEYLDFDEGADTCWSAGYDGANDNEYVIVRRGASGASTSPFTYHIYRRSFTPGGSADYNNGNWTILNITFPTPAHGSGQPAMIHSFTVGHSSSIVVGYHYGTGAGVYRSIDNGATWSESTIQAATSAEEVTVKFESSSGNYYGFMRDGGGANPKFWYSDDSLATFNFFTAPVGTFGSNPMDDTPVPFVIVDGAIHAFSSYRSGTLEGHGNDKRTSAFYITGTVSASNFWNSATIHKLGSLTHVEDGGASAVGVGSVVDMDGKIHLFYSMGNRTGNTSTLNRIANIYQTVIPLNDNGNDFDYRDRIAPNNAASGPFRKLPENQGYALYERDVNPLIRLSNRPNLAFSNSVTDISGGVLTITQRAGTYRIDTEAAAASDDLDTITDDNAVDGDIIVLLQQSSARDITYRDGTGNMNLSGVYTPGNSQSRLVLQYFNSTWFELSRSPN